MRATLKTLLITLPLGVYLSLLPTFWEGAKGGTRIVLVLVMVLLGAGLAVQSWLAHPGRRPIRLLRRQVQKRAKKLPAEAVIKNPNDNTYVYVEHDSGMITLWCFKARWLEALEADELQAATVSVRGFRINPETGAVTNRSGRAILWRNQDGTFAIRPLQSYKDQWRTGLAPESAPQYRGLLYRTKKAISQFERRGFWHRFHK